MNEDPYPCRKMARFWRWHVGIFAVTCLGTLAMMAWRDLAEFPGFGWCWLIPFVVGALLMLHLHRFVRCPSCSRRLQARLVKERYMPDSWRFLYDCPKCRITWDSRYVQDASSN